MTDELANRIKGAEVVLFDGTLWTNDEMASVKLEKKLVKEWDI